MRITIILAIVVVAAIAAVAWLRRGRNPEVMPYHEVRREIIGSIADAGAPSPLAPVRPAGLDKRLPAPRLRELQALWPPTELNWSAYFHAYSEVVESIRDELSSIDRERDWYELLSEPRRFVLVAYELESEVNNGGFDQFFLNAGDCAYAAPDALRALGHAAAAALAERANSQFPSGPPRHRAQRLAQMDELPSTAGEIWSQIDGEFFSLDVPLGGIAAHLGGKYILEHPSEFFQPG